MSEPIGGDVEAGEPVWRNEVQGVVSGSVVQAHTIRGGVFFQGVIATVTLSGVGGGPKGVAVGPDGRQVYVCNDNDQGHDAGRLSVIDTETNAIITAIDVSAFPTAVRITPDGGQVFVIDTDGILGHGSSIEFWHGTGYWSSMLNPRWILKASARLRLCQARNTDTVLLPVLAT